MKVKASLKNLRTSPRKVRLVANSVVGMDVKAALAHLKYTIKKSSLHLEKLINSAVANAENNFGLDKDNLYIESILVGEGSRLKRWLPRAHGRATLIIKRTSKIDLILEERVEGKNRKTQEEMEKTRKSREEAKKKAEKELAKELEEMADDKEIKKAEVAEKKEIRKTVKKETANKAQGDNGFLKKVFQRKSV